ncbi:MAG: winged helix-turn-helix domain-containing protein [Candidatus Hodarchaeales archaeon]
MEERKIPSDLGLREKLFFILRGSNRIRIYLALYKNFRTPKELELETGIALTSICRSLQALKEMGIIECLNEYDTRGKYYQLSNDVLGLKTLIEEKTQNAFKDINRNV